MKHYAVAGENGVGVYNDYGKAYASKTYLTKFRVKKCKTYEEAKKYAFDYYNGFQYEAIARADMDMGLPMNFTIYRKNIVIMKGGEINGE